MTESTHLMFIRHGETVGNSEQIAHGQSESPLNARGIQQAKSTAEMLNGWHRTYHRIYASPLSRAHDTGKHISEALQLPIHIHEGLKEGFLGDWEGVTYEELGTFQFARRSIKDDDFSGHNGESPNQLARRVVHAIHEIRSNQNVNSIPPPAGRLRLTIQSAHPTPRQFPASTAPRSRSSPLAPKGPWRQAGVSLHRGLLGS